MDDTPVTAQRRAEGAHPAASTAAAPVAAAGALPPVAQPTSGGSWARDPVTGDLTPLHQPVQASARGLRTHDDAPAPAAADQPNPGT